MTDYLSIFEDKQLISVQNKMVANQLMQLNDSIAENGVVLSQADCTDIAEFRRDALIESERLEIGLGIVGRIVTEFSDSGFVDQNNFRQVVEDLLECFYTLKNETEDRASDDQVMEFLHYLFEVSVGGDTSKLYDAEEFDRFIDVMLGREVDTPAEQEPKKSRGYLGDAKDDN